MKRGKTYRTLHHFSFGGKCHYPQAGRTSDLLAVRPADKGRRIISMKRKGLPIPLVLSQAFGNKKAIAH